MDNSPGNSGHYAGDIEPIEFIEALQKEGLCGYHEANAIKYIARWRRKNGVEDLAKAIWYLQRLICLEGERTGLTIYTPRPSQSHSQAGMAAIIARKVAAMRREEEEEEDEG